MVNKRRRTRSDGVVSDLGDPTSVADITNPQTAAEAQAPLVHESSEAEDLPLPLPQQPEEHRDKLARTVGPGDDDVTIMEALSVSCPHPAALIIAVLSSMGNQIFCACYYVSFCLDILAFAYIFVQRSLEKWNTGP
mmetsp:Transcript_26597/g.74690  ORF Transcript_26597/g.74690 Transcript_26597/m.74690 type:complete len:136 (-) Transcript_26597:407-814(-)|eukprot:CAMPEP_0117673580 /NCGR_PEP_ID=MMETSP0804-20121206/14550_1 /TAXON_ID=1074897 /ORGANISM="Tetraselmis astigmatica, Strain CCMP880" /LENGTH=135 /DNA_ID=CAMNT_0005482331 /DNA_START=246 /DNA_END=653 /DNA_ORIENTATION=-